MHYDGFQSVGGAGAVMGLVALGAGPWQQGLLAIQEARAFEVALVGMGVVFISLTVLFIMMHLLRWLVGDVRTPPPAPVPVQGEPVGAEVSPPLAAAITLALQLERRRRSGLALPRRRADEQGAWRRARAHEQAGRQSALAWPRRPTRQRSSTPNKTP